VNSNSSVVHDESLVISEGEALRFWRRMALTAVPAGTSEPTMPVPATLHPALRLFEMVAEGSIDGGPVPSAGALHPYEQVVIVSESAGPAIFSVDIPRRACVLLSRGEPVARALGRSGLEPPAPVRSWC
jgi:hypothetical protein